MALNRAAWEQYVHLLTFEASWPQALSLLTRGLGQGLDVERATLCVERADEVETFTLLGAALGLDEGVIYGLAEEDDRCWLVLEQALDPPAEAWLRQAARGIGAVLLERNNNRWSHASGTALVDSLQAVHAGLRQDLRDRIRLTMSTEFGREEALRSALGAFWERVQAGPALLVVREQGGGLRLLVADAAGSPRSCSPGPLSGLLQRTSDDAARHRVLGREARSLATSIGFTADEPTFEFRLLRVPGYIDGSIGLGLDMQGAKDATRHTPRSFTGGGMLSWMSVLLRLVTPDIAAFLGEAQLAEEAFVLGAQLESEFIGIDLHDTILQDLTYLSLQFGLAKQGLPQMDPAARARFEDMAARVSRLVSTVRGVTNLSVEREAPRDLPEATRAVLAELSSRHSIDAEVSVEGEVRDLGPWRSGNLVRVLHEALNNVWAHSSASRVEIAFVYSDEAVHMSVSDDGTGFDPFVRHDGHMGLRGMRRRMERLHGRLEVLSEPGGGTSIKLDLPL